MILPILLFGIFAIIASLLLLPTRRSGEIHILPGNGWTHTPNDSMQWTNDGSFGPGFYWIRTEYGRRDAWLVRDRAVGGTRVFTRVDPLYLAFYLLAAGISSVTILILARLVLRIRGKVRS